MARYVLIQLIRLYQRLLSPLVGKVCRFEPSCSAYALICVERHGAVRGTLLSVVRVCKCHPFHPGGYDPPPLSFGPPSFASPTKTNDEPETFATTSASRTTLGIDPDSATPQREPQATG